MTEKTNNKIKKEEKIEIKVEIFTRNVPNPEWLKPTRKKKENEG